MIRTIMASAITLTMMSPGFAAEPAKAQRMFFGIKGGSMKPDGSKNNSAGNIGGVIGKPVARYVSWWRAEFDATVFDGNAGTNTTGTSIMDNVYVQYICLQHLIKCQQMVARETCLPLFG